jgi:hypothetical protein
MGPHPHRHRRDSHPTGQDCGEPAIHDRGFLQLVELHTTQPETLAAFLERWRAETRHTSGVAVRVTAVLHSCDDRGRFVVMLHSDDERVSRRADMPSSYASDLALLLDSKPRILGLHPR